MSTRDDVRHEHEDERREAELGDFRVESDLTELLSETRILLPGTQIFLAFLVTLPFTERFHELDGNHRWVYVATFLMTLLSLVCMIAPAAYHRIARPIHDKPRFKVFASAFLVAGLVPVSLSIVLATFLVLSTVLTDAWAAWGSAGMAVVIGALWWAVPLVRAHDRFPVKRGA